MYRFALLFTLILCLAGGVSAQFQQPVLLKPGDSALLADPVEAQLKALLGDGGEIPIYEMFYDGDSTYMAALNSPRVRAIAADLEARGFVYEPEMSQFSRIGFRHADQADTTMVEQFQAMYKTADSLLPGVAMIQFVAYDGYNENTPHGIQYVYKADPGDATFARYDINDTLSVWMKLEYVQPDPPSNLSIGE